MTRVALMFVFAAWVVQQMAQLPNLSTLGLTFFVACCIFFVLFHSRFSSYFTSSRYLKPCVFSIAVFLFGVCWASSVALWRIHDELPSAWEQNPIAVEGVVASVPELTERGLRFRFDVEKILTKEAVVPQHISLSYYVNHQYPNHKAEDFLEEAEVAAMPLSPFHAGERWQLAVRLKRPHSTMNPHGFDFESWALSENIRATGSIKSKAGMQKLSDFVWHPSYIIERLRESTQQRIAHVLADKPYSGIIQALVMGDDSQISVEDWQVFLRTGTTHLMSISGLHITMLAGLAFSCMGFIWRRNPNWALRLPTRKAATIAGVLGALAYALIAGFSVPTQRTFYMLLVFAVALWSGRQWAITQVLALALFIVVLLDPWAVNAPGFWLSFGAVAMLAYALSGRIGKLGWLKGALQTQWAVTIGMLPLLLMMFNQTSIISPIANAFAIPLISFVVTPLALLGSFLLIDWPLNLSYSVLDVCMHLLKGLNQWPMATWQQHDPAPWTLLPAVIGVLWLLLPRGFPMRWLGLFGFLPMLMMVPIRPVHGDMKVTVLDVGQGLSVVVQTAQHTLLYDAGPKYNEQSDAGSRIVVPFLRGEGVSKLDGFVVSHNDNDHSGGMPSVLSLMPVSWFASSLPASAEMPAIQKRRSCFSGQTWTWDGVRFEMLYPMIESYDDASIKDNHRSCVLKVTSLSGSLLLSGDIEKSDEQALLTVDADRLKSDVLVAPHHGSKTSSTIGFIQAVSPNVSVFTSGYLNRYKHPAPQVLERYQTAGGLLYRSDYHGAVEMRFMREGKENERKIHVLSWRNHLKRYWHDRF
jgi:competence protein ComEC